MCVATEHVRFTPNSDRESGHPVTTSEEVFYKRAERYGRIRVDTEFACKTLLLCDQCGRSKKTECPLLALSGHARAGQGDKVTANGAWESAIFLDVKP